MKNNIQLPGFRLILIVISALVSSSILIHLLALFGIFLALSYPIWWFLFPSKTVCFLCRTTKEGKKCLFCRQEIGKDGPSYPKSFISSVLNAVVILIFTLVSLGLVFGETQILAKFGFPPLEKTASFLIPSKRQYRLGEIFPMKIEIMGIKNSINTVRADLGFETEKLELVNISTDNSFASIFVQKEINNQEGFARLTGGLPNPGFSSEHGIFGTVYFKGKTAGVTKIEFLPTSMVLANDGKGTNILKDFSSASYLILPDKISEEEEKMQNSISIKPFVLGEKTKSTQLNFYDENNVLGASVKQEVQEKEKRNIFNSFLSGIGRFDSFILSLWGNFRPFK